MIITCEKCETKFNFDATRLGLGGRKVRCASCKHVWHVNPPEIELVEKPAEENATVPKPVTEKVQPKIKTEAGDNKAAALHDEDKAFKFISINALKVAACVLILLNFMAFAYFNKSIVGQTAFYDTVGNYDTKAIEIVSHQLSTDHSGKGTSLQIGWAVKNTSTKNMKMPVVRFRLYDAELDQIGEKSNVRNNVKLTSGQELKFKDSLVHETKKARYFTVEIGNPTELATR